MAMHENGLIGFIEAKQILERARASMTTLGRAVPVSILARIDQCLGWLALNWGDIGQAERWILGAAARWRPGADALQDRYQMTLGLAALASMTGRHEQADIQFRELAALRRQMGRAGNPFVAKDYATIAENLAMHGKYKLALAFLDAAPRFDRVQGMATDGEHTEQLIDAARARVLLDSGNAPLAQRALPDMAGPLKPFDDGRQRTRGEALCAAGRPHEGLPMLKTAIDFYAPRRYEHDPTIARARAVAGLCALSVGQRQVAERTAWLSRSSFTAQPG